MSRLAVVFSTAFAALLFAQSGNVPSKGVTLRESDIPVKSALEEIRRQTGITVVDAHGGGEMRVGLTLNNAPFWQAVDALATAAGARAAIGEKDGTVRLVRRLDGERQPPTSYDGN